MRYENIETKEMEAEKIARQIVSEYRDLQLLDSIIEALQRSIRRLAIQKDLRKQIRE
jgi:hypothetical protein